MTRFLKQEAEVARGAPPAEGVTFFAGAKLGALVPLGRARRGRSARDVRVRPFFPRGVGFAQRFRVARRGARTSEGRRPRRRRARRGDGDPRRARRRYPRAAFASYQLEPAWKQVAGHRVSTRTRSSTRGR